MVPKSVLSGMVNMTLMLLHSPSIARAEAPSPDMSATQAIGEGRGRKISLTQALVHAAERSPLVAQAKAEASRSQAVRAAAAPIFPANPQVTVSMGPRFGASGGSAMDVAVSLSQRIWVAGERGLTGARATAFTQLANARLAQVTWNLHWRVHATFHRALVMRERARVASRLLTFAERLGAIAAAKVKAGEISPLQQRLASAEVAQARQAKIAADGAYLTVRLGLAELIGWTGQRPPVPTGVLDAPRVAPKAASLFAIARKRAPALKQFRAAKREVQTRLTLAKRRAWPTPTVGIQYQRESDPSTGGTESSIVLATLSVQLPLWQRMQGARAHTAADLRVATANLTLIERTLRWRVQRAATQVTVGANRIKAYSSTILPSLEQNLAKLRRSFELGEIDLVNLVAAQQRFVKVQQNVLNAYSAYFKALAELESVVGAEIWPDEHHQHAQDPQEEPS
ncbi:MAG: TolC family protein [Deltaproteobacteria bacterium]|nr:TolC family protein [Deltaproteobacteria bacterium]